MVLKKKDLCNCVIDGTMKTMLKKMVKVSRSEGAFKYFLSHPSQRL